MPELSAPSSCLASPRQDVHADPLYSSHQHRQWTLRSDHQLLLLSAGSAEVAADPFHGPALIWLPHSLNLSLKLHAGSAGYLLGCSDAALWQCLQHHTELSALRYLTRETVSLTVDEQQPLTRHLQQSCQAMVEESRTLSVGSTVVLHAQLTIVLTYLWRLSGSEAVAEDSQKDSTGLIQRLRYLIEIHYRERWPVARYAQMMGLSQDRLYACCKRELGLSPLQLLHNRVLEDARLSLQRSVLSIEQIASYLGFRDSAQFSHFFKRLQGQSPSQYRAQLLKPRKTAGATNASDFSHWP